VPWFNIAGIFGTWASAFGATLWDEAARKVRFDDPKSIESLEWQMSFAQKLGYDKIAAFNDSLAGLDAFGAGRLGMLVTGPWMLSGYRSDYPSINWRTASLPTAPGGPTGTWLGGRWVVMPKNVKDPAMAWEFMEYFCGREPQLVYGVLTTNFSVFAKDNDNEWFNADQGMKGFLAALPSCWPIPKIPTVSHAFFTALNPMIEEALRGKRSAAEAMKEATRIAQEEVDKFFKTVPA
jgi:ABC-type glycerol-3-phosphate transport system substrate-binding protein